MEKVFCYVRVSGDSQVPGDGFPRQIAACRAYAERHDIKIAAIYREEAVAGTEETMNRPAWSAMMDALLKNGVRTILIERLDRLSRSLMVQEVTIDKLRKLGFGLISTHAAEVELLSKDGSRVAFRQMMGVFAEYDKTQLVHKLKVARLRKRETMGWCEGRKPFGFYDGEHQVIERMRRWQAEGVKLGTIATRLNEAKISPRSGKRWYRPTVKKILARVTTNTK